MVDLQIYPSYYIKIIIKNEKNEKVYTNICIIKLLVMVRISKDNIWKIQKSKEIKGL